MKCDELCSFRKGTRAVTRLQSPENAYRHPADRENGCDHA